MDITFYFDVLVILMVISSLPLIIVSSHIFSYSLIDNIVRVDTYLKAFLLGD